MVLFLILLQFWSNESALLRQSETIFPDSRYSEYTWRSFAQLPEARQTIDLQQPDIGLLNAAVFFVSNRYRKREGRSTLEFDPKLRDAADLHAQSMARFEFVSHYNKFEPKNYSPDKRGKQFGVEVTAENVALDFVHRYESGSTYYSGEQLEYFDRNMDPITLHTYLSFAEQLVEDWYQSPGHRRNLLLPELKTLGCAVYISTQHVESGMMPEAYCVQNFGQ